MRMTITKKLYALFIALCLMVPTPAKSWSGDDVFNVTVLVALVLGLAYATSDEAPAQQSPARTPNHPQQTQEERNIAAAKAESLKTYASEQQKLAPSAPELHDLPIIQNLPPFDGIDVDSSLTIDVKRGHTNTMRQHNTVQSQSVSAKVIDNILHVRRSSGHGGPMVDQKQTPVGISITATTPISLCTITGSHSNVTIDARDAQNFDLYNMGRHNTANINNLNTQKLLVQNSETCTARLYGKTNMLALSAAAQSAVFAKTLSYDRLINNSHREALIEFAQQARG
jgi:hypothetical protein